jgi:hypothetical protein
LTVIVLLVLGIAGSRLAIGNVPVEAPQSGVSMGEPENGSTLVPLHRYVVDLDTWRATDRQQEARSPYDFHLAPALHDLPLRLGLWQGEDVVERNQEVFLILEPEQYVKRLYRRADDPQDRYLWLFLIGSRKLKSFHHPDICYSAIEWQTTVSSQAVPLRIGDLDTLKILARNAREQHVSLYFFIFPDNSHDAEKGVVMFRVASPLWNTEEETIAFQQDFIRQLFD